MVTLTRAEGNWAGDLDLTRRSIAMALLDGGLKRMGETVTVVLPAESTRRNHVAVPVALALESAVMAFSVSTPELAAGANVALSVSSASSADAAATSDCVIARRGSHGLTMISAMPTHGMKSTV